MHESMLSLRRGGRGPGKGWGFDLLLSSESLVFDKEQQYESREFGQAKSPAISIAHVLPTSCMSGAVEPSDYIATLATA